MIIFNQQHYPKSFLGKSKYTVARYGCLTTVVTEIYDYIFGKNMTPDMAAMKLDFTSEGYLIWSSLEKLGLKLYSRVKKFDKATIDSALSSPDKYIALQVNNNHWVWMIGRYIPVLGYRIADPWLGDKNYTRRYKNNITGFALITKK